ncbi:MAG: very short patch repair endonuclease [Armatimonadota bacterium]
MEHRAPYGAGPPLATLRETDVVRESTRRSMKANKSKDTKPEVLLRKALYSAGLRGYRCHDKRYPGSPDIWVPRAKLAVFVHGCFWHGHGCKLSTTPTTNRAFWLEKVKRNQERHQRDLDLLQKNGATAVTVWECQLRASLANVVGLIVTLAERETKPSKT